MSKTILPLTKESGPPQYWRSVEHLADKPEVRAMVTQLDREGFVDARRMRLTLAGLALAASLAGKRLPALRPAAAVRARAA